MPPSQSHLRYQPVCLWYHYIQRQCFTYEDLSSQSDNYHVLNSHIDALRLVQFYKERAHPWPIADHDNCHFGLIHPRTPIPTWPKLCGLVIKSRFGVSYAVGPLPQNFEKKRKPQPGGVPSPKEMKRTYRSERLDFSLVGPPWKWNFGLAGKVRLQPGAPPPPTTWNVTWTPE